MARNPVLTRMPASLDDGVDTEYHREAWGGGEPSAGAALNQAVDRLQNTIPGEIITFWAGIQGAISLSPETIPTLVFWGVFVFATASTPVYVYATIRKGNLRNEFQGLNVVSQSLLAAGAFVVWVYYLGGPFAAAGYYDPLYATMLVFVYPVAVVVVPFYVTLALWTVVRILRALGARGVQ